MKEYVIGNRQAGQRADKYIKKILTLAPDSFVYKMIRKKNIDLNGKKMTGKEILKEKDVIRIWFSDETFARFSGHGPKEDTAPKTAKMRSKAFQKADVSVIYEDDDQILLNKPAGMLSQKAKASDYSVNDWLIDYLLESGQFTEKDLDDFSPSICNRLDRNTSGLILAGKSVRGLQEWSALLKDRTVKKYYRCLVYGALTQEGHFRGYLTKDERTNRVTISTVSSPHAQPIETAYKPVHVFSDITELEVHLITGRSHQIRAHLSHLGHPILGDPKYGWKEQNAHWKKTAGITHQLLHAYRIELPDGRIYKAPLPETFESVRAILQAACK